MPARTTRILLVGVTACLVVDDFADAPIVEVTELELAVTDLDRSLGFYTRVLDFRLVDRGERSARIALGDERLRLTRLPHGAAPAHANDPTFQHVAIVVTDMDAAAARL